MGRAVECGADLAVVTSDNPRSERPRAIADEILQGFKRPAEARVILDRAKAIRWALAEAQPGDCVLLAGKGHEDYQIVGQEHGEVRLADCLRLGKEQHLKPGDGDLDFCNLFKRVEARGFKGHYTNAFGTLDDMLAARDYLVNKARAAGVAA